MIPTLGLIALLGSIVCGEVAQRRGQDRLRWSLIGLLCWPVALVLLLARQDDRHYRRCSDCRERIRFDAPVCRFCGRDERTARTAKDPRHAHEGT